jgi:hypothetical protein
LFVNRHGASAVLSGLHARFLVRVAALRPLESVIVVDSAALSRAQASYACRKIEIDRPGDEESAKEIFWHLPQM